MHQAVVIGKHDAVYPWQLGCSLEALFHVGMGAEAEQFYLAGLFHLLCPGFQTGFHFTYATYSVNKEEVHVIGVQSFETLLQPAGKIATSSRGKFGYQKNLLAGMGIAGKPATDALFATALTVALRCIPVVDPPIKSLCQHQPVVQNVEHSAQ